MNIACAAKEGMNGGRVNAEAFRNQGRRGAAVASGRGARGGEQWGFSGGAADHALSRQSERTLDLRRIEKRGDG